MKSIRPEILSIHNFTLEVQGEKRTATMCGAALHPFVLDWMDFKGMELPPRVQDKRKSRRKEPEQHYEPPAIAWGDDSIGTEYLAFCMLGQCGIAMEVVRKLTPHFLPMLAKLNSGQSYNVVMQALTEPKPCILFQALEISVEPERIEALTKLAKTCRRYDQEAGDDTHLRMIQIALDPITTLDRSRDSLERHLENLPDRKISKNRVEALEAALNLQPEMVWPAEAVQYLVQCYHYSEFKDIRNRDYETILGHLQSEDDAREFRLCAIDGEFPKTGEVPDCVLRIVEAESNKELETKYGITQPDFELTGV